MAFRAPAVMPPRPNNAQGEAGRAGGVLLSACGTGAGGMAAEIAEKRACSQGRFRVSVTDELPSAKNISTVVPAAGAMMTAG